MGGAKEPKDPDAMDSDEEDEDYVPGADPDAPAADDDEHDAAADADAHADDAPATLSITQQRAVDDAFLDLFGYPYDAAAAGAKSDAKVPAKRRAVSRRQTILSSIFGRRASAKLLLHARAVAAGSRPKPSSGGMIRLEKRVVAEVKRFAGQEIRVERVEWCPVFAGEDEKQSTNAATADNDSEPATGGASGRRAKGVDNLLTELSKPEKLSTISKTSADWDLFKSKNADAKLKEQLESQAGGKEAYLVKKDFLSRVDRRRFELEKGERERERARRGK
ncbi:hypothetical protein ACHAXT_001805 [Thalassiosira profunda]